MTLFDLTGRKPKAGGCFIVNNAKSDLFRSRQGGIASVDSSVGIQSMYKQCAESSAVPILRQRISYTTLTHGVGLM